jgi:hypothetical protein
MAKKILPGIAHARDVRQWYKAGRGHGKSSSHSRAVAAFPSGVDK